MEADIPNTHGIGTSEDKSSPRREGLGFASQIGLTNPLDVIEQMTYLMFIHDLDVSDNTHAKESAMLGLPYESVFAKEVKIGERTIDGTQLKWSVFRDG